ncbi:MAG TPA: hypothetical protein VJQ79_14710 [Acidimicrobiia bacterium]|nr:hypothetical protein [Acidimicrobiia bacterium]
MIELLDSAGIRRAEVLSEAYWFGSALMPGVDRSLSIADEHAKVRAENDWVADQVLKYPSRLVAFCSVNSLKSYAVEEIERCGTNPAFGGLKLLGSRQSEWQSGLVLGPNAQADPFDQGRIRDDCVECDALFVGHAPIAKGDRPASLRSAHGTLTASA